MRLIDADLLKQKLVDHEEFYIQAYGGFENLPENEKFRVDELLGCIGEVVNAPTVDAVEVIRCKDCVSGEPYLDNCIHCCVHDTIMLPDGFCSDGERKGGE